MATVGRTVAAHVWARSLIHRLDGDTSGVLVIARHKAAQRTLSDLFASNTIEKKYWALALGTPSPATGLIGEPFLEPHPSPAGTCSVAHVLFPFIQRPTPRRTIRACTDAPMTTEKVQDSRGMWRMGLAADEQPCPFGRDGMHRPIESRPQTRPMPCPSLTAIPVATHKSAHPRTPPSHRPAFSSKRGGD